MHTRCPQCETLYRLTSEQIDAAGGKVRCSRCNSVFNAVEHMEQSNEDSSSIQLKQDPPEPLLSQPENSVEAVEQPTVVPNNNHSTEKTWIPDILLQPASKEPGAAWWAAAFLLTVLVAVQMAWLDRTSLVKDPQGKEFLVTLCDIVGCSLPQPRDPIKFRVLSRDMSSHPEHKNALLFMLVMANKAGYAQPYPFLQLNLFDNNRRPAGHRIFAPKEYLDSKAATGLLQPDEAIYISLELLDPGPSISGFEIKFL